MIAGALALLSALAGVSAGATEPVPAAGTAAGLPYYTMPFVRVASLLTRLTQWGN